MFSEKYKVTVGDINYGGHMGNERALLLFHQGRIAWLNSMGFSEANIGEGIGTIQKEAHVVYNKEIFIGEELNIHIVSAALKRSSFKIGYEIVNIEGSIVISGSTLMIAYNYKNKKMTGIPKEFKEKVLLSF